MEWFQKTSEQKKPTARYYLGEMYHEGYGASRDDQVAASWFLKAAQQGDGVAQHRLAGLFLHYGNGCTPLNLKKDNPYFKEAVRWYREAAQQGSASAQDLLGTMYRGGMGVKKNEKIADEWAKKSAERIYKGGSWFKKAIDDDWVELGQKGIANAQAKVGAMYLWGNDSLHQDYDQAGEWLLKATKQGNVGATMLISHMLGAFADKWNNKKYVFDWVQSAAEGGLVNAQFLMAESYESGEYVPQDNLLAHMWYNLAAAQGIQWAKWAQWAQKRRDDLAKQMTAHDISEAQRLARE